MDTPTPTPPESQAPPRHGCLTTLLVFIILLDLIASFTIPTSGTAMRQAGFHASPAVIAILEFCAVANIVFAIALFRWQRWGFYGFVATTLLAVATNLIAGLAIAVSLLGLLRIGLLYWVLSMGGPNKAWNHLK